MMNVSNTFIKISWFPNKGSSWVCEKWVAHVVLPYFVKGDLNRNEVILKRGLLVVSTYVQIYLLTSSARAQGLQCSF